MSSERSRELGSHWMFSESPKNSCLETAEFLTASGARRAQMACYKIPHALGVTCSRKAREAGCATCPWPTSVTYQRQKCTVNFNPSHRFKEREKRERERAKELSFQWTFSDFLTCLCLFMAGNVTASGARDAAPEATD
jgi:hypothetical protein